MIQIVPQSYRRTFQRTRRGRHHGRTPAPARSAQIALAPSPRLLQPFRNGPSVFSSWILAKTMASPALVLASTSPRRRALLAAAGIRFSLDDSGIEEVRRPGEPAPDFAQRMAEEKALAVSRRTDGAMVLGAD